MPMQEANGGNLMWSLTAVSTRHNGSIFFAPDPSSSYGQHRVRGLLAMNPSGWEGLETAADYERLLTREYPRLPPEFIDKVGGSLGWTGQM
jgi:hypothetical protein